MKPPNLLFIYTDEQAFNTLAAYGNEQIEMPNLNRLAEQSHVFDRAYVTQPVCTASRSALLTGLYAHTNGCTDNNVPLPQEVRCLPEMLAGQPEYATAHIGKWHLGDELFAQHGFREWVSLEDGYTRFFTAGRDKTVTSDYRNFLIESGFRPQAGDLFSGREAARLPEQFGKPAFLARESARFIREHREEPFILYVNFLEPHMPFFGPRDEQYDPERVPLPPNFDAWPDASQPLKARVTAAAFREWGHSDLPLRTSADWQRLIANYWGLCSLVDTHAGTILDTLQECGLEDSTIVVFTSDHGDMMGSHRLLAKCLMFEEAVRVPLLIRLPGQSEGKRIDGPVSQIDLVPTLLDLLRRPIPQELQGESLRPLLESRVATSRKSAFIEWTGTSGSSIIDGSGEGEIRMPPGVEGVSSDALRASLADPVRTVITPAGWKLNYSPLGEHELYQLFEDPGETRNLFGADETREVVFELVEQIVQWQRRTGDSVEVSANPFAG